MENDELIRRVEDLAERCERSGTVTHTAFLTPAEQLSVSSWAERRFDCRIVFSGGHPDCERRAAFFLPFYMEEDGLPLADYIRAIGVTAGFGAPGHRDYMGAVLGLGVRREWIGDIWVKDSTATVFCLPGVERHILESLDKVGKFGVKTEKLPLEAIAAPERIIRRITFSVKSMRLDAVSAGMFCLSRTKAAELITLGSASLNYAQCFKCDAPVKDGDVISLRGFGKGTVHPEGTVSRKGRLFVTAEINK